MKLFWQKYWISLILVAILGLGLFLRTAWLSSFPAGFNADEAAIGYNAYSLLQTGKDEYGTAFPLAFKSFGDFKPGLYFYFVLPFVAIFGLTELAVRLPSALFGVGTIFLIFLLSNEVFKDRRIGLISAFLLSITPWHIHFSRGGWETNVATFFITLGVFLFIKGLRSNWVMFWSLFSFLISMYLYQSPRLVVPVLVLGLGLFFRKQLKVNFKAKIKYLIVLLVLTVPLVLQFTSGGGSSRFSGLSFLSDAGPKSRVEQLRGEHDSKLIATLLHNKVTGYGTNFLGHYLDHFSLDFLFINGDPLIRNKVPEVGQFYLIEALFLVVGFWGLVKQKIKLGLLLILWILISPLASSLTYQTPSALRALSMVVPLTMIMGFGLWSLLTSVKKLPWRFLAVGLIGVILIFETAHYLDAYFIHYPKRYPLSWEYGFNQMVDKLQQYQSQYKRVVITDRYDQPYILVLFYEKYDPKKYQPQAKLTDRDKFNFGTVRSFDKYEFHSITTKEFKGAKDTLFIGTESEIEDKARIFDRIKFPNGEDVFVFAKSD